MQSRPLVHRHTRTDTVTMRLPFPGRPVAVSRHRRQPLPDSIRALIVGLAAGLALLALTAAVVIHTHTVNTPTHRLTFWEAYAGR